MKRIVFSGILLLCSLAANTQGKTDSCSMEISLLTVSPGADLYSIFGHTGIRVRDTARGMDVVFNYGFFDDSDPLFYVHFTKGIMRYSVNAETIDNFMAEYQYAHRSVQAQILNLTCSEKQRLFEALRTNTLEENKYYDYQFHTDNCTTRASKIIEANTSDSLIYGNVWQLNSDGLTTHGLSLRGMIHEYLDKQQQYWSEFGIDLCLGRNLDYYPTNTEAIHFLPDYLYRGMEKASEGNKPLVLKTETLIGFPETKTSTSLFTPLSVFTAILILVTGLYLARSKPAARLALKIFDILFFILLGLAGILISYLWIARVDDVCRDNLNVLWAMPAHLVAVFFIHTRSPWVRYYFLATALIASILLIGFPWWFQRMNIAVLPLLGIIIFRSLIIFQRRKHAKDFVVQRSKH